MRPNDGLHCGRHNQTSGWENDTATPPLGFPLGSLTPVLEKQSSMCVGQSYIDGRPDKGMKNGNDRFLSAPAGTHAVCISLPLGLGLPLASRRV